MSPPSLSLSFHFVPHSPLSSLLPPSSSSLSLSPLFTVFLRERLSPRSVARGWPRMTSESPVDSAKIAASCICNCADGTPPRAPAASPTAPVPHATEDMNSMLPPPHASKQLHLRPWAPISQCVHPTPGHSSAPPAQRLLSQKKPLCAAGQYQPDDCLRALLASHSRGNGQTKRPPGHGCVHRLRLDEVNLSGATSK